MNKNTPICMILSRKCMYQFRARLHFNIWASSSLICAAQAQMASLNERKISVRSHRRIFSARLTNSRVSAIQHQNLSKVAFLRSVQLTKIALAQIPLVLITSNNVAITKKAKVIWKKLLWKLKKMLKKKKRKSKKNQKKKVKMTNKNTKVVKS